MCTSLRVAPGWSHSLTGLSHGLMRHGRCHKGLTHKMTLDIMS